MEFDTPDYLEEDLEDDRVSLLRHRTPPTPQPDRKSLGRVLPGQPSPAHILSVHNNVRAHPAVPEPSV